MVVINLIPNEEKKQMVKGFYSRLVVLFFLLLGFSAFIFFIALLPSYFLASVKTKLAEVKLEEQKGETMPVPDQKTLSIIADLDKKLDLIERAQRNTFVFSEKVINAAVLRKLPQIAITDITYESDASKGKKISIGGTATSRESLLLFRQALEDDVAFSKVDLPISNFVQGSNIRFSLSLIPS